MPPERGHEDSGPAHASKQQPVGGQFAGVLELSSLQRRCMDFNVVFSEVEATAAKQIITDQMDITIGGGVESISLVQTPQMRVAPDPELIAMHRDVYMPMLGTAETVAQRYKISREAQDEYALQSQQRTAAAQAAGRFDAEIVPATATMSVKDKETGEVSQKEVTLTKDEGNRADTTLEGLASLQPVLGPGTHITAGNASQLSDGSSACMWA